MSLGQQQSIPLGRKASLLARWEEIRVRKGGRKKEQEMAEGRETHLYKELQLPVVQEMDLTSPALCHLGRKKDKGTLV